MVRKILCIIFWSVTLSALQIREPFAHEIADVAKLYFDAWHNTYDSIAPHLSSIRTQENCLKKWQQYYLKGGDYFILIALENKIIVGVAFSGPLEEKPLSELTDYDSEIDKLYIAPLLKNRGIGSALFKASVAQLRSLGFKKIIVRSLAKNENANKFYEKMGGIIIAQPLVEFNERMNIYAYSSIKRASQKS